MRYHCDYQPTLLNSTPEVLHIGPWRLHYLAFSQHSDDPRPPVLLLGGLAIVLLEWFIYNRKVYV